MPRFLTGDELGNIKCLHYNEKQEIKINTKIIHNGMLEGKQNPVQALSVALVGGETLLAAARADGAAMACNLNDEHQLEALQQWREPRLKLEEKFVGLNISSKGVFSCTSNGALRLTRPDSSTQLGSLPTRLREWRLASDSETFVYGGTEVDLSVWNTEMAFISRPETIESTSNTAVKKRKRDVPLFPGEVWRAKNLPNDHLDLRQPVRISSLSYISPFPSATQHHLVSGTQLGDVRRYDTRAGRRPIANWTGVAKIGGIKLVEKGLSENELFVSDSGGNLFALDLRNGGIAYRYKCIAGAVTSVAPSPGILVSASLDRFCRVHSTFPLPSKLGKQQEQKGQEIDKLFMKSTPTVVVWDQQVHTEATPESAAEDDPAEDDDVWDGITNVVGESSEDDTPVRKTRKNRKPSDP